MTTKTNKITHIERVRRENASIKMQVQNALNWDDLQYAEYQQDMGYMYLQTAFGDVELANEIPYHKEYWSWWRLHWVKRDRLFLELVYSLNKNEMADIYKSLHDASDVYFTPHRIILEESYTHMIHKLVKEAVQ